MDARTGLRRLPVRRGIAAMAAAVTVLLLAVALPVLGQDPNPSPAASAGPAASAAPAASTKPGNGPKSEQPGKSPKASHAPEVQVTLRGTVGITTAADGERTFTLAAGGKTYELEVGPPWWWGDANPLTAAVGKSVTIVGEQAAGSTSIDVLSIDGKIVREPGRPPWAGGWRVVGPKHPGWAQWKADKAAAKAEASHGRPSWAGPKTGASDDPND